MEARVALLEQRVNDIERFMFLDDRTNNGQVEQPAGAAGHRKSRRNRRNRRKNRNTRKH